MAKIFGIFMKEVVFDIAVDVTKLNEKSGYFKPGRQKIASHA